LRGCRRTMWLKIRITKNEQEFTKCRHVAETSLSPLASSFKGVSTGYHQLETIDIHYLDGMSYASH
jgi:hypothetical protein